VGSITKDVSVCSGWLLRRVCKQADLHTRTAIPMAFFPRRV
jgi:hypothetical protein